MTTKHHIIEELDHEARHILKTTVLDLDAFLALTSAERAARWQQWDVATKRHAVQLMQVRKYGVWYDDLIDPTVALYDAKWSAPAPVAGVPDAAVAAALEELAERYAGFAQTARAAGDKADATYFRRLANSFVKGLQAWQTGIRPIPLGAGKWLLPSSRIGGAPHARGWMAIGRARVMLASQHTGPARSALESRRRNAW